MPPPNKKPAIGDITLNRQTPESLFNLGSSLHQQGKLSEAAGYIEKCLELKPDFPAAYFRLSKIYREQDRIDFAAASLIVLLDYEPNSLSALFELGNIFAAYRDYENAIIYFKRITEIAPDNEGAQHAIAALSGITTKIAPRQHVQNIFNDLASTFEEHLTSLEYHVPERLKTMLVNLTGGGMHFNNALDLGCGTGLSGVPFRKMTARLTGLDLSQKMLNVARMKNIYDELAIEDACVYLESSEQQYDLFIATDVFIYIGELEKLFKAIGAHSNKGAYFLFSIETAIGVDYILRPTGRYAHSANYIKNLADGNGFTIVATQHENLRMEGAQPIKGELFVLQKSA